MHFWNFLILKTGVYFQSFEDLDNCWFTCCALHNVLLDYNESIEGVQLESVNVTDMNANTLAINTYKSSKNLDKRRQALIDHFTFVKRNKSIHWVTKGDRFGFSFDGDE